MSNSLEIIDQTPIRPPRGRQHQQMDERSNERSDSSANKNPFNPFIKKPKGKAVEKKKPKKLEAAERTYHVRDFDNYGSKIIKFIKLIHKTGLKGDFLNWFVKSIRKLAFLNRTCSVLNNFCQVFCVRD